MKCCSDVVIVGAGVSGMTAAIYLKRAGIDCVIVEKEVPGGQILKAFSIENYPGFVKVSGRELSNNIYEQIQNLNIDFIKDEVTSINIDGKKKRVVLNTGNEIEAKAVILAVGRHPKKLSIPNLSSFVGKGLSYCATCDGRFFKDKNVIVIGGSNSALEEAMYLSNICKNVTIVYRRSELRAEEAWQEEVRKAPNIDIKYNCELDELIKEEDVLTSAVLRYDDGKKETINIDGCFSSIGYEPTTDVFDGLIKLDDEGYIDTDVFGRTNIDGIYAAGDVVRKGVYQLITAMNDAVVVANSIGEYVKTHE